MVERQETVYIGLDLSDLMRQPPYPSVCAVLDESLSCEFGSWHLPGGDCGDILSFVDNFTCVLSIDGPQGLAGTPGAKSRRSEREARTPGHSSHSWPPATQSYAGLIEGAVRLFANLVLAGNNLTLYGYNGASNLDANLIEVYPGAAWPVLVSQAQFNGGQRLPKKELVAGRIARRDLLIECGVGLSPDSRYTHDQLDAVACALIALRFKQDRFDARGVAPWFDDGEAIFREGYIIQPG